VERGMKAVAVIGVAILALGARVGAQDSLRDAKDLYASASYEAALSTLTKLSSAESSAPDIRRQAEEYRAFCLFALGRTGEAESVAEGIIKKDPFVELDPADASPRLEAMFTSVRKRLLPSLIRERVRTARSGLDRKDYPAVEPPLMQARLMIHDAEKLGVKDESLGDLGVLVDGFLQMIQIASEQRASSTPPPSAAAPAPAKAVPAAAAQLRTYTVTDEGVTPPVVIDQRMPALNPSMMKIAQSARKNGILEVVIDESGDVVDAIVRQPLMPAFDALVASTARRWKYRPATLGGVPVRYVKTISLVVP
jgi:hypothetical protein